MPDREKVINKVTAIVADMQEEVDEWKDYSDSELRGGLTCDCDWWYKTLQTLNDALALLKAQEPRLVTIDDFKGADEYGWLPAWCEEQTGGAVYCECILADALKENGVRYWTGKPSDEQKEAVKWG